MATYEVLSSTEIKGVKERLRDAKKFYVKHRTTVLTATGFVAGVVTTLYFKKTPESIDGETLWVRRDFAEAMLEDNHGAVAFDTPVGRLRVKIEPDRSLQSQRKEA